MSDLILNFKSLTKLSLKEHFIYWIAPFTVTLAFLLMFCFGGGWMTEVVSPAINREFGIMENLATIVVGIMVYYSFKCFKVAKEPLAKGVFIFAVFISLFLFLEELDYGLHFYELWKGISPNEKIVDRNFHNQDLSMLSKMKTFIYIFIAIAFVLIPLIGEKPFPKFYKQFIASPKLIFTALSLEATSLLSYHFVYTLNRHGNYSLDGNTTEFGECIIYYILLLYLTELFEKQKRVAV